MKAEIEKPLSPEFQADRSKFRYFPESRHFALEFPAGVQELERFRDFFNFAGLRRGSKR